MFAVVIAAAAAAAMAVGPFGTLQPLEARAAGAGGEERAVRDTVALYFRGHATGDRSYWREAFHLSAVLFWNKDGAFSQRTSADFIAGAAGKPAADEARRRRRIAMVDITGDVAVVKVELHYPERRFTDYLSLLKVDGSWKIVNKTFTSITPPPKR